MRPGIFRAQLAQMLIEAFDSGLNHGSSHILPKNALIEGLRIKRGARADGPNGRKRPLRVGFSRQAEEAVAMATVTPPALAHLSHVYKIKGNCLCFCCFVFKAFGALMGSRCVMGCGRRGSEECIWRLGGSNRLLLVWAFADN